MRVAALGSGSRGNSVLVEAGGTRILVDAGFSGARIARDLAALDVDPESVAAVVVSHEHRDHTSGIGVAARRWGWPLYLTEATAAACAPLLTGCEHVLLYSGRRAFRIGALDVEPFRTCHDAADPLALCVRSPGGRRLGVATDLGRATAPVRHALAGCHFLVLEANHDEVRLRDGPYPWPVKQRIGGTRGHLSNRLAGELAAELAHPELGGILLAHLSAACNDPGLARDEVEKGLDGGMFRGRLEVAEQDVPSEWFEVDGLVERAASGVGSQLTLGLHASRPPVQDLGSVRPPAGA